MAFPAMVTDIRLYSRDRSQTLWQIALDHTPLSAANQRGALTAISASGAALTVEVESVTVETVSGAGAQIWHLTRKPLPVGTQVAVEIFGEASNG